MRVTCLYSINLVRRKEMALAGESVKPLEYFRELQFLKLSQQSNIYGLSSFAVSEDNTKVVVATLGRSGEKIFSVEVNKLHVPRLEALDFSYIPGLVIHGHLK